MPQAPARCNLLCAGKRVLAFQPGMVCDLAEDIGENNNLADEQKSKAAKMKKLLDKWESQVDPPLYSVTLKPGKPSP